MSTPSVSLSVCFVTRSDYPAKVSSDPNLSHSITHDLVERAFEKYKIETPDYDSFLMDWASIHRIATSNSSRSEQFKKFTVKLRSLVASASALLRFETASCTVGREIHTDQALSMAICSPGAPNVSGYKSSQPRYVSLLCLVFFRQTSHLRERLDWPLESTCLVRFHD